MCRFFRYKGYTECFEYYTELDSLGRCGTTIALVGKTTKAPDVTDSSNPAARDYVLNMNTKKFHYPACGSVNQMSQKNRKDVHLTSDEIVSQGYSPCGNCKP